MPSLVEELQAEAVDSTVPITDLLRRVKIAATKLGLKEPLAWVKSELDGYYGEEIPQYRFVPTELVYYDEFDQRWRPLTFGHPEIAEAASKPHAIARPIRELEDLVHQSESVASYRVSDGLRQLLEYRKITSEVRVRFSRSSLAAILDAVRTRVLDWALDLERAGILGDGVSFSSKEKELAQQAASTIKIYGNGSNFAGPLGTSSGPVSINATQHNTTTIDNYDARKLAVLLREGAGTVSGADGASLHQMADEIDDVVKTDSPDQGRLHTILRRALTVIPQLVSWAGRTAAESEIHRLLEG